MERASNKVCLKSINRAISRQEFVEKMENIPLMTNLIRVETFFKDKSALDRKTRINELTFVTFTTKNLQFVFKFNSQGRNQVHEGTAYRLEAGDSVVTFEMNGLYEQETLADVR